MQTRKKKRGRDEISGGMPEVENDSKRRHLNSRASIDNVTVQLGNLPVQKWLGESPPLVEQLKPVTALSAPPDQSLPASNNESSHDGMVGK